jgi:hypothetical protein
MAGKGMGAATRGGGAVEKGPKNRVVSETSKTTGPVMMAKGGAVKPKGMMAGGMMSKGYAAGGAVKKMSKGAAAGGKRGK